MYKLIAVMFTALVMLTTGVSAKEFKPVFDDTSIVQDKPAKVPTGIDVKGCKDYYIKTGTGKVYPVCKKVTGERWWWLDVLPPSGGGE